MQSIVVHIANEDAIVCEIDNLPDPKDQSILVHNLRRRDGKDVHYLDEEVTSVIFPLQRINFIQILPSGEISEVVGFVRE
jgi:hypothetical protein